MLLSLVYVSRAASPLTKADLLALRTESSEGNAVALITGLLLHRGGTFLQDLEGPEESVLDLYARIRRDPRHTDVTLVWTQPVEVRRFARWSMAVADLDEELVTTGGPADTPLEADIPEAAFVRELLDLFDVRG